MTSLPWLDAPLAQVLDVHAQNRLPHALLIRAQEGWGEVAFAEQLALQLIGRQDAPTAKTLAHADLRWIEPDGAVIKVDEIRELAGFAVGTRQSAPCKVGVVESAELMNLNAANALLKTLEEPPRDTYLLLTSARPGRLLPTIVSRCQVITIGRNSEMARDWLGAQWPDEVLGEKLFECGDAPLMVHEALIAEEPPLGPLLKSLAHDSPVSKAVGGLLAWDIDRLTSAWYRHCVALLAGNGRIPDLAMAETADLAAFVDELSAIRRQLLTTNSANQRLLYERLAARWQVAVRPG